MRKPVWIRMLLIMHALVLGGCAVTVEDAKLIPVNVAAYASTGKTIRVSPVIIRPQPKPGFLMNEPPRFDSRTFRDTIIGTLRGTGLFSDVRTDAAADYTLTADVVGQRVLGGASNVGLLLVHYSLVASDNNKEIWSGNIFSHFEASAQDTFYGGERVKRLLEKLARDNMAMLGKKLGEISF